MNRLLRSLFKRRRAAGVVPKGSYSVEAEVHRTEELRVSVEGVPSEEEIRLDVPHDPWRPARTLGKL